MPHVKVGPVLSGPLAQVADCAVDVSKSRKTVLNTSWSDIMYVLNFFVEKGDDSKKLVCLIVYSVEKEEIC